ncbi:MAG: BrnT family toxin [Deltaproteobacteria bacterium]|nr:BrnT family toxin [Deltaproteobacteria bacterium]
MDITCTSQGIIFIWNEEKAEENWHNHHVSFETACEAFFDPFLRISDASRNFEAREGLIGTDKSGRLLFVVFIEPEKERIRIISARQATSQERKYYENV